MFRSSKILATASVIALGAMATPALAEGTQSGTSVTNNVSVSFTVGGEDQTAVNATDTFTVDRKVNLTVVETGNATTQVSPGEINAVTAFTVTNTSNDTIDIDLLVEQQAGGTAKHGGTDTFDVNNVRVFLDVNGDGAFDAGDTLINGSFLDEVAPDEQVSVLVVVNIPINKGTPPTNLETGDVSGVTLTGTALAGGAIGRGAVLQETNGANTAGVDTVFADGAGATDAARDGKFSDQDDYTVLAASLTAEKISRVISDPFNNTTNPKAIPGATIEYCISVSNAPGSATAADVVVTDPVPGDLTFIANSIRLNGSVDGSGLCQAGTDTAGASFDGTTVTGPLEDIPAGESRTLTFRATVQ
ncbi:MAG: hypothetical protein WA908_06285 [Pontixanthobacter sp.]